MPGTQSTYTVSSFLADAAKDDFPLLSNEALETQS